MPLQVNVSKVWLTVSSVLLAFSFVFGTAIRNTFESVVFLFVVHPYDVGDVLMLIDPSNTGKGPQYCQVSAPLELHCASLITQSLPSGFHIRRHTCLTHSYGQQHVHGEADSHIFEVFNSRCIHEVSSNPGSKLP